MKRTKGFALLVVAGLGLGSVAGAQTGGTSTTAPPVPTVLDATLVDAVSTGDQGGTAVSIDGSTMAVGIPRDDGSFTDSGAVAVYARNAAGAWVQQVVLTAPTPETGAFFGNSVAVAGDVLVVGAPLAASAFGAQSGRAYVYVRSGGAWTFAQELVPTTGAAGDNFGASVATTPTRVVVGAPRSDPAFVSNSGSVFLYERSGSTWGSAVQVTATSINGDDQFGTDVAISGDLFVVGTPNDDFTNGAGVAVTNAGTASVFSRAGNANPLIAVLQAADARSSDLFGDSVDIDLDAVVVGARGADGPGAEAGAAYVYRRQDLTFVPEAKLVPNDAANSDNHGSAVAISGDAIVVGAWFDDIGTTPNAGSATIWNRRPTGWTQMGRIAAPTTQPAALVGQAVDLSGSYAVIGGSQFDANGTDSGGAFVFRPGGFSLAAAGVAEGTGGTSNVPVTVNLGASYPVATSVHLTTEPGTASAYADYTPVNRTVTLAPGQTSVDVLVPVVTDSAIEGNEFLVVEVASSTGAPIENGSVQVTITDDDTPPPLTASVADGSRAEGNSGTANMTFAVTLSAAPTSTVTLRFTTSNGSAVAPGDFTAKTNVALAFQPGQTTKNFTVPIVGDLVAEGTETFTLTMVSATGATIGDGVAIGTITDTDV